MWVVTEVNVVGCITWIRLLVRGGGDSLGQGYVVSGWSWMDGSVESGRELCVDGIGGGGIVVGGTFVDARVGR